jgi:3-demethoxyubiquinol 3-hydroxylase
MSVEKELRVMHACEVGAVGLFYGVLIGLCGLKAIGTSTYTIEKIVDEELELALCKLRDEPSICNQIRLIQQEEVQHKNSGQKMAGQRYFLSNSIERVASIGAYTAKFLASSL